ncbi:MAG: hypothetical protein V2A70_02950 [Candidatus Omnitrophota bacterium]
MKHYRTTLLVIFVVAFMAVAQAYAQTVADGQPSILKEDKTQANYVYDLKLLIKKSKDNIKTVNEKIKEQAVIKRNQQREAKARQYYEQGLKLQEEGRLEEARILFDKAIRITEHPEMTHYIKDSERRSKLQQTALERQQEDEVRRVTEDQKALAGRAEDVYASAVSLYKQQKFAEARDEFKLVEEMMPDFKAVRSYLQIVDQDIAQAEHLNIKEQKNEIERQQKDVEIARLREKELWRKEIEKKEAARVAQLREQAQVVYNEAIKLYQERQFLAAREKFQQVEWVVPDFKATRAYLTRIENDVKDEKKQVTMERQRELEKQRWADMLKEKQAVEERRKAMELREQERLFQVKDQAEFVYKAAVALFDKNLIASAKDKFAEVEGIYPDYKSTRDYLKRIEQDEQREILKKKADEERRVWEEELVRRKEEKEKFKQAVLEADVSYADAMKLYQTGRLIEAKEKLLVVDQCVPDYKSTRSYLKRIDADIELLAKTQKSQASIEAQREELEKMRMMNEKAEVIYTQAVAAYDAKNFDLAKAKFIEVNGIFLDYKKTPVYLNRIDEEARQYEASMSRVQREKDAEASYAQALSDYQAGRFQDAKKKFVIVESFIPNYKKTSDYLDRIDDDILRKKEADLLQAKEDQVKGVYDQAMALYQNSEFSAAKEKFLEVEVICPGYKETTRILGSIDLSIDKANAQALERRRAQEADQLYLKALASYKAGNYTAAKEQFVAVEVVFSGYKDTLKYLGAIESDIERKKKDDELMDRERQVGPLYDQALDSYRKYDFLEAKQKFLRVQALFPGYKETAMYLARIDKDAADLDIRLSRQDKARRSDAIYAEAVKLYGGRQFNDAKLKFNELAALNPGYKNLRVYLSRIDKDIADETLRQERLLADQQASEPYAQAVMLYHDGDFESAKAKFIEAAGISPDYQKIKYYLSRLDRDIARNVSSEKGVSTSMAGGNAGGSTSALMNLYKEGVQAYKDKKYDAAVVKFEMVKKIQSGYRSTQQYLDSIKGIRSSNAQISSVMVPAVPDSAEKKRVASSVTNFVARDVQESRVITHEQDDAKAVKAMSARSNAIYREIRLLSKDMQAETPDRTFARVDKLIDKLEAERQRMAAEVARQKKVEADAVHKARIQEKDEARRQLKKTSEQAEIEKRNLNNKTDEDLSSKKDDIKQRQDQWRRKELVETQRLKDERREIQLKTEVFYQKGAAALRLKDYEAAHGYFVDAQNLIPDYKDTSRFLIKIERTQGELILVQEETKDRARISRLAENAAALNVEILELSQRKEYETVEKRFNDLETILKDIQGVKAAMVTRRSQFESDWDNKFSACKNDGKLPAVRKTVEMEGTVRERAVALFREGQQLYAAGQYPEARVKFIEAVQIDPTYKASMTFVKRIDRLLVKKDFEVNLQQQKLRANDLDAKPGMTDVLRASQVSHEGTALYKEKRFREARIKFEELYNVGNTADQRHAQRYLLLIDRAIEKEKQRQAADQRVQEERFLKERRAQAKMDWERGKLEQERQLRLTQQLSGTERDKEIQREQQIRLTEEENAANRRLMIEKKVAGSEREKKEQRAERDKYIRQARENRLPVDVKAAQNAEVRKQDKASQLAQAKPDLTDAEIESSTKSRLALEGKTTKERRRLDQLESSAQRERRLKEENSRRIAEKEEKRKRQAAAKWAREKKADDSKVLSRRIQEAKEKFSKDMDTDAFIQRNQQAVESILKEQDEIDRLSPAPVLSVVKEPVETREQKHRLDAQRAAIRKDFEVGVERIYAGAIQLFKKKLYADAKADFVQVDRLVKGYKRTAKYLRDIDRCLEKSEHLAVPLAAPVKNISKSSVSSPVPVPSVIPAAPVVLGAGTDRRHAVIDALDTFDVNIKE